MDIEDTVPSEPMWLRQFKLIQKMRQEMTAPVDILGCDRLADPSAPKKVWRFQTLVALMLSSQTKDQITAAAMKKLQQRGLSAQVIKDCDEDELADLIKPVGFYRVKAKNLIKTAQMICDDFTGDIPNTLEGLQKLPGVGPKMAYLALQCAWDRNEGIGVDVHVHRISDRLEWTKGCRTPEDTRKQLQDLIPAELWPEVNPLLVGFGQMHCTPQRPKCTECLLQSICPFGAKQINSKRPTKRKLLK